MRIKNEIMFAQIPSDSILKFFVYQDLGFSKKKVVQIAIIF
jgi:hypothetical protein